jgi:transcriptional regulator with XRE-family HTH domain
MLNDDIGHRVQLLRKRCRLSIRQLAQQAQVTPAIISCIERGKTSPSITMLQKILSALGSDLAAFFAEPSEGEAGPVFLRQRMQTVSDAERSYTIIFPRRPGICLEMFDEQITPGQTPPPFETLKCDMAGYILSGVLALEIEGQDQQLLRPGDAFYIPRGCAHRGLATNEPVRLVTVYHPASY